MTEKDDDRTYSLGLDDEDVIGKYIGIIKNIRQKELKKKEGKEISFFYRGQMDAKYDPVPYVLRSEHYGKEDRYWHEIQKLRENDFAGKSHLDKLSMM